MEFCRKDSSFLLVALHQALGKLQETLNYILRTQSLRSKVTINLVLVLVYGYLLATSRDWSGDHVDIGCIHILTFLPTVHFLLSLYAKQFLAGVLQLLSVFGWLRVGLYTLFVVTFSYLFVAVLLDQSVLLCMAKAKDLFLSRFESNIMSVNEDRQFFDRERLHPLSGGDNSPNTIHHLVRYPMEDAQMNCTTYIKGFSGGKPFSDHVEWRRNGVPLESMSDRYSVVTKFRELPPDHIFVDKSMRALGLGVYELNSTLSIYLLDEVDFGSYTCHILDKVSIPVHEWSSKTGQKSYPNNNKRKGDNSNGKKKSGKKQPFCQCTCLPERKYVFQDMHTQKQEFRLIKMGDRHDQIEAPVASVLFFSTNYVHLYSDDDVRSDYTVNDVSFQDLCSDKARFTVMGCSSLQRVLAFFMPHDYNVWWFLDFLPLSATRYEMGTNQKAGHCLCENSFGRHNMKYTRKYYNRTSEGYELFEIVHPQTLFVRPPKQNSSSFFDYIWNPGSMKLLSLADYLPEYTYDLSILRDLAVVSLIMLNLTDAIFICLGLVAFLVVVTMTLYLFQIVGQVSAKCFLEGSMGYLVTAIPTAHQLLHDRVKSKGNTESEKFHVFLSHSDAQVDEWVVADCVLPLLERKLGLKVCLRHRDLPPDELELKGLSQAIENSQLFIIFLSKNFLQEPECEMETAIIIDRLLRSQSQLDALVIKLDDSVVPGYWTFFTVHDWTTGNLSMGDHHLRLVQWLTSRTQQVKEVRTVLDVLVTVSPFLLLSIFLFLIQF